MLNEITKEQTACTDMFLNPQPISYNITLLKHKEIIKYKTCTEVTSSNGLLGAPSRMERAVITEGHRGLHNLQCSDFVKVVSI